MRFIKQILIIFGVTFLGELLHDWIPLPVPASIYGLVLMLAALCLKIIRVSDVKDTAMFLIEIMPILFLPAAVGLMDSWHLISSTLLQYIVITILAMVIVMAAGGLFTQFIMKKVTRKETCHE